jgi:WXG100 family type VII secretion target
MASKYQIQMDFQQATQKANELHNIATELSNLSKTEMQAMLSSLGSGWQGKNATAYIQKGNALQAKMENTAKALHYTANTISTVAQNLYNAEMAALYLAQQREAEAKAAQQQEEQSKNTAFGSGGSGGFR